MKDDYLKPSAEEEEHRRRVGRAMSRGAFVGLGLALLLGWILVSTAAPAPDDLCDEAAQDHLEAAEAAGTSEERRAHAELARAYQAERAAGGDCDWWSP